ncbi:MAG: NRDE family protein [Thermoanaerobaculia bacterium]
MCLIAVALNAHPRYPLVIAANRDEDFTRPSEPVHVWRDDPRIIGGRDRNHGGSWLAMSTTGRFAAVTNLRGAMTKGRSRGLLVSEFVAGDRAPRDAAADIIARGSEYAGFHLVIGDVSGQTLLVSNADGSTHEWSAGIHGVSNAPPGVPWPKVHHAIDEVRATLSRSSSPDDIVRDLLTFLATPGAAAFARGSTLREEAESDVFVIGDRYGTRSSTVIVAGEGHLTIVERTFRRAGVQEGEVRMFVPLAAEPQSGPARTS